MVEGDTAARVWVFGWHVLLACILLTAVCVSSVQVWLCEDFWVGDGGLVAQGARRAGGADGGCGLAGVGSAQGRRQRDAVLPRLAGGRRQGGLALRAAVLRGLQDCVAGRAERDRDKLTLPGTVVFGTPNSEQEQDSTHIYKAAR